MTEPSHNNFKFCKPGAEQYLLLNFVPLVCGIFVVGSASFLSSFIKDKLNEVPRKRIHRLLFTLTFSASLIGILAYLFLAAQNYGALISCTSPLPLKISQESVAKWISFLIHIYFTMRVFIICIIEKHRGYVEMFIESIEISLFFQDVIGIILRQHMLAFQFLIICSIYHNEMSVISKILLNIPEYGGSFYMCMKLVVKVWLINIVLANFLKVAEEWNTIRGQHLDFRGLQTSTKSTWQYVYWMFITVSTVGFGDIIPSTQPGQVVLVLSIIFFLTWFSCGIDELRTIFQFIRKHFTNKNNMCNDKPSHHIVFGCESKKDVLSFLDCFPKECENHLLVLVSNPNSELLSKEYSKTKVMYAYDPLDVIQNSRIFHGHSEDSLWLLYKTLSDEDPIDTDIKTVSLVNRIKQNKIKARMFVRVTGVESQHLINEIEGWNCLDGSDICIASQLLDAHMLIISAHSSLSAALIAMSVTDNKLITEETYDRAPFSSVASIEYFNNGRVLLGTVSKDDVLLMPHHVDTNSDQIFLVSKHKKDWQAQGESKVDPLIKTIPHQSNVSVITKKTPIIKAALAKHPSHKDLEQLTKCLVFAPEPQSPMKMTWNLFHEKQKHMDDSIISTLDHRYEACMHLPSCVCGIFENWKFSAAILTIAYEDAALFQFWLEILEDGHLKTDVVQTDCTYGDLFISMLRNLNRISLGVEITQDVNGIYTRLPKLNPSPDLEIRKGDLVCFLHL